MLGRTPNFGGWGWLGVGCLHLASSRVASSVARAETRRREVSRASMLSHRPPSSELTGPASEGRSLCSCSVPPFQKSTITTRKWQFEQSSEHETREHSLAGSTYLDTIPPTKALEDPCIDVQVIDALQGLDLALEAVLGAGNWHRHAILFIADWTSPPGFIAVPAAVLTNPQVGSPSP